MAGAPLPSQAQTRAGAPAVPLVASAALAPPVEAELESVTTLLKLDSARIAQLDRAYTSYARARLTQEAQISEWQEELRTAQGATSFDERKATQLSGNISGSENKIATAYLKARGEALNALTSQQRIDLEKLEFANRQVRDDKYRFLLLSQVEDLWRTPLDPETGRALLSASDRAAVPSQQTYYRNYYAVPPVYNYPLYSYGWNSYNYDWNSYNYGFQAPFYARPNYGWNGNNYSRNDRRDRNARPRWDRTEGDTRPSGTFGSQGIGSSNNRGGSVSTRPSLSIPRPREERRTEAPVVPQWERQRESPRPAPSSSDIPRREPTRPEPTRPEPPQQERTRPEPSRPEPPRPEPPRVEPRRPEPSNNDAGSRWDRGGGGRETGGGSRTGRGR